MNERNSVSCPDSGLNITRSDDWNFSAFNRKVRIVLTIIGNDIVHFEAHGYFRSEVLNQIWPSVNQAIVEEIGDKPFYLMYNFKGLKGISTGARFQHFYWLQARAEQILGIYFYHIDSLTTFMIKTISVFYRYRDRIHFKKDYFESIQHLLASNTNENYEYVLNDLESLTPDVLERYKTIVSKSGKKYEILNKWVHRHLKSKTITYQLNNDILLRIYLGNFDDQTLPFTEKSLDEIVDEIGLEPRKYHFYIDFSYADNISLKYRKEAVKWYERKSDEVLTSGFFNLSPVQRAAVSLARSFSSSETIRKKVFILNKGIEMFNIIEKYHSNFNYNFQKTEKLEHLSKKQLIEKVNQIQQHQEKEISIIYKKLARLSWDENYEFEKYDIDESDDPFAVIHNSIRLIQDDMEDILIKRDNLIKKAEESDQLKSAFLANMSHEIRTPMNSIVGFCELLLGEDLSEDSKQYLNIIQRNGHYLLTLINDIIDVSKIEADQLHIAISQLNLNDFVNEIFELFKIQMKDMEAQIQLEFQNNLESEQISIQSDAVRLKQALLNLISNALKFTRKGKVSLIVSREHHQIVFEVSDTGIGISEEDQKTLFQRFGRSSDQQKNIVFKGSGLGLSIAKACVEMLGGKIRVNSKLNKGSSFKIYIPES